MKITDFNSVSRLMEQRTQVMQRREQWGKRKYDCAPLLASLIKDDRGHANSSLPMLDNDNAMSAVILKAIQTEYEDRLKRIESDLKGLGVDLVPELEHPAQSR